jgi:hypothetical protein
VSHLNAGPSHPIQLGGVTASAQRLIREEEEMNAASSYKIGLILRAAQFAAEKHRNQRRKDADASPYINHPIALANVLHHEGGVDDVVTLCAALLHDTVEDTDTSPQELAEVFGSDIVDVVLEVTDDKSRPKAGSVCAADRACALRLDAGQSSSSSPTRSATCATSTPRRRRTGQKRARSSTTPGRAKWWKGCEAFHPVLERVFDGLCDAYGRRGA